MKAVVEAKQQQVVLCSLGVIILEASLSNVYRNIRSGSKL